MDLRGHTNRLVVLGLFIPEADFEGVELDVTVDGERHTLAEPGLYDRQAPRTGPLKVEVALRYGAEVLAMDSFTLEVSRPDVQWVHGYAGGTRPSQPCDLPVRGVPIVGSASDSLFIAYGRLPHGINSC